MREYETSRPVTLDAAPLALLAALPSGRLEVTPTGPSGEFQLRAIVVGRRHGAPRPDHPDAAQGRGPAHRADDVRPRARARRLVSHTGATTKMTWSRASPTSLLREHRRRPPVVASSTGTGTPRSGSPSSAGGSTSSSSPPAPGTPGRSPAATTTSPPTSRRTGSCSPRSSRSPGGRSAPVVRRPSPSCTQTLRRGR